MGYGSVCSDKSAEVLQGALELAGGGGAAFRQAMTLANRDGFRECGGAAFEGGRALRGVELGQPPTGETQVVERDPSGDLALRRAPGQSLVEEADRLVELGYRLAKVGDCRGEVVLDSGAPAVVAVLGKVRERPAEALPCAGEVCGRAGASEEHADVVDKARLRLVGREPEAGQDRPKIVCKRASRRQIALSPQLFLRPEPVPVRRPRIGRKGGPEVGAKRIEAGVGQEGVRRGLGVAEGTNGVGGTDVGVRFGRS